MTRLAAIYGYAHRYSDGFHITVDYKPIETIALCDSKMIDEAVREEREACAKIADDGEDAFSIARIIRGRQP